MRLFIAFDIDKQIRESLSQFIDAMRKASPDARWVKADNLHVTLKFLGEVKEENVPGIKTGLASIHMRSPEVKLANTGLFGTRKKGFVFWVGVEADERLTSLVSAIEGALAPFYSVGSEDYTPHLTLARFRVRPKQKLVKPSGDRIDALLRELSATINPHFGTMAVREFVLYESKASRHGSEYIPLACYPLTSTNDFISSPPAS